MGNLVKKTTLTVRDQILAFAPPEAPYMAIGIQVNTSAAGSDGIVKAGTPMAGNIETVAAAFTKAATTGDPGSEVNDAVGILLHDVKPADDANGTLLIFGAVNLNRLDTDVQTLIDEHAKKALDGKIWFLKR